MNAGPRKGRMRKRVRCSASSTVSSPFGSSCPASTRQPGIDDLVDDEDVAAGDLHVEVLDEADPVVAAHGRRAVSRELDEIEGVMNRHRAGEVDDERDAGLERPDEQRLAVAVVAGDL